MPKNNRPTIAVSGSLAYDQIMDFPGRFRDHILADKIHELNVCFNLAGLRISRGGTAGNIAYNLTLLKIRPIILGVVGSDFLSYREALLKWGADLRYLTAVKEGRTATAQIITDQDDNQITAFYPGPKTARYQAAARRLLSAGAGPSGKGLARVLAIISPDDKERMMFYARLCQAKHIPYIFDPGQSLFMFSGRELLTALRGAKVLIGNDYEIGFIAKRVGLSLKKLANLVEILITTRGGQGSEILAGGKKIIIKPAKPKNTSDPTGAGDAYRAGLIAGLARGLDLKTCGQLAATVAVYTVEKFGTQTHRFTLKELTKRYRQNYKEKLNLK